MCLRSRLGSPFVCRLCIIIATVSAHVLNFWVTSHPGRSTLDGSFRKQIDHLVSAQIHQNRAEFAPPFKRKIVYAQGCDGDRRITRQLHDASKNGHPRGGNAEASSQSSSQTSRCRQANSLNGLLQTKRHLRPWLHESGQPFSEDLTLTCWIATKKLANREMELVAAMCLRRLLPTEGTASRCPLREDFDSQRSFLSMDLCDPQPFRKREKSGPFHQQLLVITRGSFFTKSISLHFNS